MGAPRRRLRLLGALAAVYASGAAASWLGVPWATRRALREVEARLPGFSASAADVRFDPFRLALTVRGFALSHEKLGDLATCDEVYASVQPLYLLRLAVGLRELRLTKPRLIAVIAADGGTALSYLPASAPEPVAQGPRKAPFIPRIIIRRFALERGALELDSRLPSAPQKLMAFPIDFSLENFSTLPDAQGAYTFAARTNRDESLRWDGKLSVRPPRLSGHAAALGIDLSRQDTALPASPVAVPEGRLDAEGDYALSYEDGVLVAALSGARVAVKALSWKPRGSSAAARGPFSLAVDPIGLELRSPLPAARGAKTTLRLDALVAGRGQTSVDAVVVAEPLSGTARLRVSGLPLTPFTPLAPPPTQVSIDSGSFSMEGRVALSSGAAGVTADLSLYLDGLAVSDAVSRRPLTRLRRFSVEGVRAAPASRSIAVDRVRLQEPFLRLSRAKEGRTNVEDALGLSFSTAAAAPSSAAAAPQEPPWRARLKRFTLSGGRVVVEDDAVAPPFALSLKEASASLSDLSTDGRSTATFSAKALLESAPVSAEGAARVSSSTVWVDAKIKAAGVQLSAFTPYSIMVIGYKLDKGTLDLDLAEALDARDIRSRNKVVVDQLTLGEKVDSPTAVNAPIKLGLAILKDRRGVIDLDVPVDGSLDDPEFRLMPIVLKTLINVIVKAATSPFDALSKAFGGGADLSKVSFPGGGAALEPEPASALDKVAQALADRPELFLGVRGASAGADALALGDLQLRRRLRGSEPGPEALTPSEEKKVLSLHASELGAPAASLAEARAALARRMAPGAAELRALAQARAAAVHEHLKAKGVDAARLFSLEPVSDPAVEGPAACELQLEAR